MIELYATGFCYITMLCIYAGFELIDFSSECNQNSFLSIRCLFCGELASTTIYLNDIMLVKVLSLFSLVSCCWWDLTYWSSLRSEFLFVLYIAEDFDHLSLI
ncbi:hypothetical protein O6H91_22G047600 [Diphasiastrum complanatum]|uniref:Uncharacterized protein n=1 Tax=Diphasiastrum complanatum TaxID=34168 RepID=A0ACC2AFG0_DIPCM|nr:hypothetical protein O6H91_22G047600 [Diphasiastrum complanatum]